MLTPTHAAAPPTAVPAIPASQLPLSPNSAFTVFKPAAAPQPAMLVAVSPTREPERVASDGGRSQRAHVPRPAAPSPPRADLPLLDLGGRDQGAMAPLEVSGPRAHTGGAYAACSWARL